MTAVGAATLAFGAQLPLAQRYADLLAGPGIERGLLGPREADRVWERHLLNSAALADYLPECAHAVDVGSGAGLPGLPIAIRRPDVTLTLLEPMLRRVSFLLEAVAELGLGARVRVLRGRAEDRQVRAVVGRSDWVVARAVAPLGRLVRWCLPLLSPGGRLLALKGSGAGEEVAADARELEQLGAADVRVERLEPGWLETPTWVVMVQKGTA